MNNTRKLKCYRFTDLGQKLAQAASMEVFDCCYIELYIRKHRRKGKIVCTRGPVYGVNVYASHLLHNMLRQSEKYAQNVYVYEVDVTTHVDAINWSSGACDVALSAMFLYTVT